MVCGLFLGATLISSPRVVCAESPNLDIISFLKSPPLKLTVNVDGEKIALTIKNVSPVTLILSKRSISNMDILWFIKLNGQRITSGVRGEVISDGQDAAFPTGALLREINENKEFVTIDPGETVSFPIPKKSFTSSGVMDIADSISGNNPLDVTVALSNPIVGLIGEGERFETIQGQLTLFSIPIKLARMPSLE